MSTSSSIIPSIDLAVAALQNLEYKSIRACAKAYGVPESTLRNRYHRTSTSRQQARQEQQRLSPRHEGLLINWILVSEECGHPVNYPQIREFVTLLSTSSGDTSSIGVCWVRRFIKRHPELRSKIGRKIDHLRVKNSNPEVLAPWFDRLKNVLARLRVNPRDI
jgi:helix-turn-helix, Psq domain